uniref:Secreted protein n=1 Tax=Ascaris lumbricoides TaxID=6252 RepID=A0A0M3HTY0_ASCLU
MSICAWLFAFCRYARVVCDGVLFCRFWSSRARCFGGCRWLAVAAGVDPSGTLSFGVSPFPADLLSAVCAGCHACCVCAGKCEDETGVHPSATTCSGWLGLPARRVGDCSCVRVDTRVRIANARAPFRPSPEFRLDKSTETASLAVFFFSRLCSLATCYDAILCVRSDTAICIVEWVGCCGVHSEILTTKICHYEQAAATRRSVHVTACSAL